MIVDDKLQALEAKFEGLAAEMSDPSVMTDMKKYQAISKAYSDMGPIIEAARQRRKIVVGLAQARTMLAEASGDAEMKALAKEEIDTLEQELVAVDQRITLLLLPKDPNDQKNVILEVRAGTGGDEASLFAAELLRMYLRYAEHRGWKASIVSQSDSGAGGIKEAIVSVEGRGAFSRLKHESGVHRVQRVPETEAAGRIHTSAASVAVMPEVEEVEIDIPDKDLRLDTFCASGAGGQSVNTTYSAVRIVHLPTGITVQSQDERSQQKNRISAMKVLRARVKEAADRERNDAIAADRKAMVGSGDRSEKIRTYNYPQSRVTDHRVPITVHRIHEILNGDLDEIVDPVIAHFEAERLRDAS